MHRIRLDAAWDWLPDANRVGARPPRPRRIKLPVQLDTADFPAALVRVFHPPSGLSDRVRLRLCFAAIPSRTEVALNGRVLVADQQTGPGSYPITAGELADNNRITLRFDPSLVGEDTQVVGPVWLEIDETLPSRG